MGEESGGAAEEVTLRGSGNFVSGESEVEMYMHIGGEQRARRWGQD